MIGVLKKELIIIFRQPLLYIIAAIFSLIAGIIFYSLLIHYVDNVQDQLMRSDGITKLQLITSQLIFPLIGNINFLMMVLVPAMVMNSFSDEYKEYTFPLLVHSSLSPWVFIFAKYIANVIALTFILSSIALFPLMLWYSGIYEYSFLYMGFLGIFFNIAFFTAIGLWCSSLTKHPVLAMFLCYVIILFHWLFPTLKELSENLWWINVLDYLSCSKHFEGLVKGEIKGQGIGFYIINIGFFQYCTRLSWAKRLLS